MADETAEADTLLARAGKGSERHLGTLRGLKNKVARTHQSLSTAECAKTNRAASRLVEAARLV